MNISIRDIPAPPTSTTLLKLAMRRLTGGVVVVTAGSGDERVGLTATSAVSLSVDPPTMLVCVNRSSSTWPVIARRRHFCVSILGAEHQAVAERFAGIGALRGAERYQGADWVEMASGASGLAGAQAIVDCEIDETLPGLTVTAEVKVIGPTGVEMEALTAVSVACLTIYDMVKAADRGMRIEGIRLLAKDGGRSGAYRAEVAG